MHEGLVKSQQFCSMAAILWQDLQAHYPLGSAQSLAKYSLHRRTYQGAIIGYLMKSSQYMAEAVVKQLADTRFLSIDGYAVEQIAELLTQQKFLSPAAFLLLETCETGVMAEIQQAKNNFHKEKLGQDLAVSVMQASEDTIPLVSDGDSFQTNLNNITNVLPDEWPVDDWLQALSSLQQTMLQDMLEC